MPFVVRNPLSEHPEVLIQQCVNQVQPKNKILHIDASHIIGNIGEDFQIDIVTYVPHNLISVQMSLLSRTQKAFEIPLASQNAGTYTFFIPMQSSPDTHPYIQINILDIPGGQVTAQYQVLFPTIQPAIEAFKSQSEQQDAQSMYSMASASSAQSDKF